MAVAPSQNGRKSEQLSREQLALFAAELKMSLPEAEEPDDSGDEPPAGASASGKGNPRGRKPLPRHLKRERIEHDLPEKEKHCRECHQDLRKIGEPIHGGRDLSDQRITGRACARSAHSKTCY